MTDDDFELLSAYLDGEATLSERARVESSVELTAEVERLRTVAVGVARVPAPSDAVREAIIAAALAEFGTDTSAQPEIPVASLAGRRSRRWMPTLGAAAAAIVVIGGFAVTRLGDSSGDEGATRQMDAALSIAPPATTIGRIAVTEPVVTESAPAPPLPVAPNAPASAPVAPGNVQADEADDVMFEAAAPPAPAADAGQADPAASELVPPGDAPSVAAPMLAVLVGDDDVRMFAADLGSLPTIAESRRACRVGSLAPAAEFQPSDGPSGPVVVVALSDGRLGVLTVDDCRLVSTVDP